MPTDTASSIAWIKTYAPSGDTEKKAAVMYLDLDGFKGVNDRHGHAIGDRVLQETAERLRNSVREMDVVGRIGGDEFVVLLTELDADETAAIVAQKLIDALNEPMRFEVGDAKIGASIGIAPYLSNGADGETLLHKADEALYRVKHSSKNAYAYHS